MSHYTFGRNFGIAARSLRVLPLLSALLLVPVAVHAAPPAESRSDEIEALKRRVEELEAQNHRMMQLISAMEKRLNQAEGPETQAKAAPAKPTVAEPVRAAAAPAATQPVPASSHGEGTETLGGSRFRLYGMLRMDMDIDTQRPNSPQVPFFITSPSGGEGGSFAMHPRLTRFGLDFTGPRLEALGNAQITGKLETDFENGGSESRQVIRIRHAYVKSAWGKFSILAGQTWDVFSPLFPTVNSDSLMWFAGNLGDRRPQLRVAYEPKVGQGTVSVAGAIGLMGAIDNLDIDHNGYPDGVQSMRPNVQWRLGYSRPLWVKGKPFSVGGSMFQGWLEVAQPFGGRTILPAAGYNADFTVPMTPFLALRGEGWWGRNMGDFRGGAGQSVTPSIGRVVRGRGGWAETQLRINKYWTVAPGFTTDNPVKADLAAGSRTRNRAFYFANRFSPGGTVQIGADYLRWRTDYFGLRTGYDNRVNLFVLYGF